MALQSRKVKCPGGEKTCHLWPLCGGKASQSSGRYTFNSLLRRTPSPCNCRVLLSQELFLLLLRVEPGLRLNLEEKEFIMACLFSVRLYCLPRSGLFSKLFIFNYMKLCSLRQTVKSDSGQ